MAFILKGSSNSSFKIIWKKINKISLELLG